MTHDGRPVAATRVARQLITERGSATNEASTPTRLMALTSAA